MPENSRPKGINYHEHDEVESPLEQMGFAASATECTGLMPTPPENKSEEKSYRQLFSMEVPLYAPSKRQIKEGVYDEKPPEIRS